MIDIERRIEDRQSGRELSNRLGDWRRGTGEFSVSGGQTAAAGATRAGGSGLRRQTGRPVLRPVGVEAQDRTETGIDRDEQRRKKDERAGEIRHRTEPS